MKRFTLILLTLLAFGFTMKAQQLVSTEPANRNVVIEEFTGRGCGYCPIAHRVTHEVMTANPGRVWGVSVHSTGSLSPTTYPNLNTAVSGIISNAFPHDGIPAGVFNRNSSSASGINESGSTWVNYVNQLLNQPAECNVAGKVAINPDTRIATITVEVYYTGNSSVNENYLTVVMLQDSIIGAQSDYGNYNPSGWLGNGQYVHMHVLREVVTPTWGEAISPTTQGTLITKTYEYQIPETVGSPNGVEVKLEHVDFLAWVSERYQGTPTRPILNVCELEKVTMTDEPLYPSIAQVTQTINASCSQTQAFKFHLTNIGTETINSLAFNVVVSDSSYDFEWTGELASTESMDMEFEMEVPFGSHPGVLHITEVNGEAFEYSKNFNSECLEWTEVEAEGDFTNIKVFIVQDQWGEQTTWKIINSAGEVVAEGGPYQHLVGAGSTQVNLTNVTNLPTNDCYLFTIFDDNGNGICCNYGNGYYYVKDGNGHVIFGGEGNGDFGALARHMFSITSTTAVGDVAEGALKIYPNPANDYLMVEGEMTYVEVYNTLGQCLFSKPVNGSEIQISLSGMSDGIYFLRVSNAGEVVIRKFSVNR